jgi:hypothetical protein
MPRHMRRRRLRPLTRILLHAATAASLLLALVEGVFWIRGRFVDADGLTWSRVVHEGPVDRQDLRVLSSGDGRVSLDALTYRLVHRGPARKPETGWLRDVWSNPRGGPMNFYIVYPHPAYAAEMCGARFERFKPRPDFSGVWPPRIAYWATDGWCVSVPHWQVIATAGVLPGLTVARRVRRSRYQRRRSLAGLCPACGYDLRATPDRCPECGVVPTAAPR